MLPRLLPRAFVMLASKTNFDAWDWAADRLAVVTLFAIALIALLTFRDYGPGWDDLTHAQYGEALVALYASGFTNTEALSFVNLYMYGGGFDMMAALLHRILPLDLFETRRLAGAAVGLAGLFITWRLGRRVVGAVGGLVALVLLAICPLYYGHMFTNPKDMPFAVAMALLLLGLVKAFERYPRPPAATVALFGLGLGLTIGSRIIGGLAVFYGAIALAFLMAGEANTLGWRAAVSRAGRFVLMLLPGVVLAYLVMGLVWPWGILSPLNPLRAAEYFSHFFEKPWKEMFAGSLIQVTDMPRSYVPILFALRMPEIFLILSVGGVILAVVEAANPRIELQRRTVFIFIAAAAILPVVFTVLTRPAMYNGIRHFVFVTPPLAVLGAYAATFLFDRLRDYPRWQFAAIAAFMLAVALPVYDFVRLHPYQYTHFNRFAGGARGADASFMLDYWGLSLKQASEELRAQLDEKNERPPAGRVWRIAVCGPHAAAEIELGPDFDPTWDPKGADFAMMLGEFYCAMLDAPIMVEIVRDGIVYARVYDIRGRSIGNLFTIPPVQ